MIIPFTTMDALLCASRRPGRSMRVSTRSSARKWTSASGVLSSPAQMSVCSVPQYPVGHSRPQRPTLFCFARTGRLRAGGRLPESSRRSRSWEAGRSRTGVGKTLRGRKTSQHCRYLSSSGEMHRSMDQLCFSLRVQCSYDCNLVRPPLPRSPTTYPHRSLFPVTP